MQTYTRVQTHTHTHTLTHTRTHSHTLTHTHTHSHTLTHVVTSHVLGKASELLWYCRVTKTNY